MDDLWMCGWRVRSELPLPDLWRWNGDRRRPDVEFRIGPVPEPSGPMTEAPGLQIWGGGRCHLNIPRVARFLVQDGRKVIIDPAAGAISQDIQAYLLGTVLGLLCHQRGLFPLHAACLQFGGTAVALSGPSGAGKSTLAAALWRRGHRLLADDVCVIDLAVPDGPVVLPVFPRLKLQREALDLLGISPNGLEQEREGMEKYRLSAHQASDRSPSPVPLRCLFLLDDTEVDLHKVNGRLKGFVAVSLLIEQVYRRQPARALGRERRLFEGAVQLVRAVPVYRLAQRRGVDHLNITASRIEEVATKLRASEDPAVCEEDAPSVVAE